MMKKAILNALRALADPTRLSILMRIRQGEMCACELPKMVRVSQPAVSQHLSVLFSAGLVKLRIDGRRRLYRLSVRGRRIFANLERWE